MKSFMLMLVDIRINLDALFYISTQLTTKKKIINHLKKSTWVFLFSSKSYLVLATKNYIKFLMPYYFLKALLFLTKKSINKKKLLEPLNSK